MFDRIDPKLLPFIDSEARQLLQGGRLSVDDHQALLDEAKKKHDFIEASIPKPTLDDLRRKTHSDTLPRFEKDASIREFAERQWYEDHRAEAIRVAKESGWRDMPPVVSPSTVSEMDVPTPDKWTRSKAVEIPEIPEDRVQSVPPDREPTPKTGIAGLRDEVDRSVKLMAQATELLQQRKTPRALDRNATDSHPDERTPQAANSGRLKNALELLTQHPKLSAGGGATVFLIAAISLEFSGGRPWKVGTAAAIGYLVAFLLLVFVFHEARLFTKHRKGTVAASGVIFIGIATIWYLLLPDEPLTAKDIATEVWKHAPAPARLQDPSPVPLPQQSASSETPIPSSLPDREIVLDKKGVAIHAGMTTLYPQMQLEYNYKTRSYRLIVNVDNTAFTFEACIRLLDYYPQLKANMLKEVERSSEAYLDFQDGVLNSALVINHKGSLTKEQIKQIGRHAKKLKIGVALEGPSLP